MKSSECIIRMPCNHVEKLKDLILLPLYLVGTGLRHAFRQEIIYTRFQSVLNGVNIRLPRSARVTSLLFSGSRDMLWILWIDTC